MMLLILSRRGDTTVDLVLPKLARRGVDSLMWDPGDSGHRMTATVRGSEIGVRLGRTDLAEVSAVWVRRPGRPAGQIWASFLTDVWELLPATWFPCSPSHEVRADNKLAQLALAARLGLRIPETTVTSDPHELGLAYARAGGKLIAKPPGKRAISVDGEEHLFYTTLVSRRHLASRHRLRHEPITLQPYVEKSVEIRVTVVGERVFPVEIDSQAARTTRVDWRLADSSRVRNSPHELPADVADRCRELTRELGLAYGAIDLIRTPEGEYVFLELNPNGQWEGHERLAGVPISDAVADWLAAAVRKDTA
ncbi:MAG: hypothetical protein HOV86_24405 [Thermoactinospora sp.]|nr:hypothetical protein [Thermoactinospora sp.]